MKKELFTELLESVREGGMILRGEHALSRTFPVETLNVQQIPSALPANTLSCEEFDAAFEGEVANFERMRSELLLRYPNQVVAIYHANVIATGDDILQVYNAVVDKYGMIPCYIQRVASETPRKVRIPTAWNIGKRIL